jgi:calcineurin-like phosphoesterase family protein
MRTWEKSHYNSWHLFGHSHGKLPSFGKSFDIGVDTNDFYPYSFDEVKKIMDKLPDNFNLVRNKEDG